MNIDIDEDEKESKCLDSDLFSSQGTIIESSITYTFEFTTKASIEVYLEHNPIDGEAVSHFMKELIDFDTLKKMNTMGRLIFDDRKFDFIIFGSSHRINSAMNSSQLKR